MWRRETEEAAFCSFLLVWSSQTETSGVWRYLLLRQFPGKHWLRRTGQLMRKEFLRLDESVKSITLIQSASLKYYPCRCNIMKQEQDYKSWNPYLAGSLTGLLLVLSVWFTGKYVGASTTFVRIAGLIEKIFNAKRVARMEYFIKELPMIDWQWMFVLGIFFGSLIAATTSRTFRWQAIPSMWEERFGQNRSKRAIIAFVGGAIAMFGARLADG
jgi:hypothetical protein